MGECISRYRRVQDRNAVGTRRRRPQGQGDRRGKGTVGASRYRKVQDRNAVVTIKWFWCDNSRASERMIDIQLNDLVFQELSSSSLEMKCLI